MRTPTSLLALLIWLAPLPLLAQVTISEIAWMGGIESANHEWIELHNSSDAPVSVDGWTLTDSGTLTITLSGTIAAGDYVVLERTSDASAPGTAFLIYTGALANTGTTLTLKNETGAIVDQVAGGEGWASVGGDNTTKDTAQYTGSRWVTALATPGAANSTIVNETPTTTPTVMRRAGSTTLLRVEKKTVKLELADVELSLGIEAPELVYVNQAVSFAALPSGPTKVVLDSLNFSWNFGDLATSSSRTPIHRYQHAGEYVVTVSGAYGRHQQVGRTTITVLPVTLSLSRDTAGNLQLNNDAGYELVLSGYRIGAGTTVRTFPDNSVILPRATITVSGMPLTASVWDSRGAVVASEKVAKEEVLPVADTSVGTVTIAPVPFMQKSSDDSFSFASSATVLSPTVISTSATGLTSAEQATTIVPAATESRRRPLAALMALLTVAVAGIYLTKPSAPGVLPTTDGAV